MIQLRQLTKTYGEGPHRTTVLDHLDLTVDDREIAAVVGPSGAGKSTLAACVTLLEPPTSGSVVVGGRELSSLGERDLRDARRQIGTVFQSDGLLSRRTAAQNVELPLRYLGVTPADRRRRVAELLDRVGLSTRADHYPHQLSGGQRQRVGIARALALRPRVLLADEATSGLDPEATASVVRLLRDLRDDLGLSILFITHEMETVLDLADSAARLDHGRIVEQGRVVDLLRDPSSSLGRALLPRRAHAASAPGTTWSVSYAGADVPPDWLARVGTVLGVDLALLGASIGAVDGHTVGHATVAVPASTDPDALVRALAGLGLHARRTDAAHPPVRRVDAVLEPVA
ncbi:methionine ABC transporter ATP-binding protein [Actinotalea sp. K2]|uniref:methionine ABC transporter ATP-binding protein n=1 Tax=Actinotalea sp. K2 TaxID=2939438 RepID=UPI002017304A|nr:ATP-binding cassette domain-containing protein [Actinotalea sp. K2]MCL3859698.1 ATP-binding cassette domain-containing protein [Actinotalea sp. K2]